MKFITAAVSLLLLPTGSHAAGMPKMLAEPAYNGKALGPPNEYEHTVSSSSAILLGECSPETPYDFELYGPSGVAAIGAAATAGISVSLAQGEATMGTEPQKLFIGDDGAVSIENDDMVAYSLEYSVTEADVKEGVAAQVRCTQATDIIVLVRDQADMEEVQAILREQDDGDELEIVSGRSPNGNLQGRAKPKKGSSNSPVSFDSETGHKIKIKHQGGNSEKGLALVDAYFTSNDGYKVRRTLVHESKLKKETFKSPRNVPVKCCDITDDGDIEVRFPGALNQHDSLRVDVRMGVLVEGSSQPMEVVDVTSFLTDGNTLVVHGGWIRNAIAAEGKQDTTEGWDVVVMDAIISDPQDSYRVVGVMKQANQNGIGNDQKNKRNKLSQAPLEEEVSISEDMKVGKKPTTEQRERRLGHGRRLQSGHRKLLVHGYCASGNPFPISHFANALAFSDPGRRLGGGSGANNWSHDVFARKIDTFADNNGLTGCGCIAHSQGGAACLHLYTYYWSCLDYPSVPGRMIQSVGTPYQGTSLAGNLAAIGDVFGAGCGSNTDLTYSGASAWLSNIPSWARSQVRFYTTAFEDRWWAYDYCHLGSDLLLSDPDDGTTEKAKGQLSGAVNGGHKDKQCHTTGMRDPPQYNDYSRNSDMSSNAQY